MGEFGDALEALVTSAQRWNTVRGTVEEWADPSLMQRGIERTQPKMGVTRRDSPPGDPFARAAQERLACTTTARVWARGRDLRVERESFGAHDKTRTLLVVRDGQTWWRLGNGRTQVAAAPPAGVFPSPGVASEHAGTIGRMVTPGDLLAMCDVAWAGSATVAGRAVVRLRAVPRKAPGRPFVFGADDLAVDVDLETGVLLRVEGFVDGGPALRSEFLDLEVDAVLDDGLFPAAPRDAEPMQVVRMPEPLAGLGARVPFPLFAPADGAPVTGFVLDGEGETPKAIMLHVMAPLGASRPQWLETIDPRRVPTTDGWERHDESGVTRWLWQGEPNGEVHVRLDRDGTMIWLRGVHDRTEALSLVAQLRPER